MSESMTFNAEEDGDKESREERRCTLTARKGVCVKDLEGGIENASSQKKAYLQTKIILAIFLTLN